MTEATGDLDVTVLYATSVGRWTRTLAREAADAPDVIVVEPFHEGTLRRARHRGAGRPAVADRSIGVPAGCPGSTAPAQDTTASGLDAEGIRERIARVLEQ